MAEKSNLAEDILLALKTESLTGDPQKAAVRAIGMISERCFLCVDEHQVTEVAKMLPPEISTAILATLRNDLKNVLSGEAAQQERYEDALREAEEESILCKGLSGPTGGIMPSDNLGSSYVKTMVRCFEGVLGPSHEEGPVITK